MAVTCPHCGRQTPRVLSRGVGNVTTKSGAPIRGDIDSYGFAHAGDHPILAVFALEGANYSIGRCADCKKEFVLGPDPALPPVWPLPNVSVSNDITPNVRSMVVEAKKAHAVGSETAALLVARTALLRMLREQKVSRFKDLAENGTITAFVAGQADEVRLWANVTGHEDVPEGVPEAGDVTQLIQYLDIVFDSVYIQRKRLEEIRKKRTQT
jgi:hypothetical protein